MQNLKEGQKVSINDDNWDTLNKIATVVSVHGFSVVVLTEDGTHRTLAIHQVTPVSFLTEIENDGKNIL